MAATTTRPEPWHFVTLEVKLPGRSAFRACVAIQARDEAHARRRAASGGTVVGVSEATREGWLYVSKQFPLPAK